MSGPSEGHDPPLTCALFVTCLADQFYPEIAHATVRVLEHHGVEVVVPRRQTCCGQPVFNNGLWDEARAIARRAIALFEPYPYVVLPSGSCAAMVREHYEHLFDAEPGWQERARRLAEKTYEIIEFLEDVVGVREWPVPELGRHTAHYPCHFRPLGITPERARQPLEAADAGPLMVLDREEQCCGFGGAFSFQFPELSRAMLDDKLDAIQRAEAGTVVVNDAGCRMHLAGGARRRGLDVRFVHLVELLARHLEAAP